MATIAQPAGTVTLVFTDIEGSTRLLSELGQDAYRQALADHRGAVREAFGGHGGYEVDYEGDAFFYAFGAAAPALRAVGEALEALEAGPIRVRVGIHTGEPGLDPPKYVGLDVHKAARIMAAGHGGQVLVSNATRELVGDEFPLRELGEFRLKDLPAPERLHQLGERDFPALKTLYRTNLPIPATPFLGREREVAEVSRLLRDGVGLLTLTGPGGTGKTRLGLQAVADASDGFADGVWWVPLSSVRDSELVLPEVARTIGVVEEPDRELTETLAAVLTGKRTLFLVDNAEHLLPEVAGDLGRLREAGAPTVVVTSRERLQLAGERIYPVPPLDDDEGVALFEARAAALDPGFATTPAVAELCARLDRLPLAIELAAARTPVLSPEQILQRLSQRFDLLKAGREVDPRQRTLRSTIEWSYDLLDPGEQALFARLAVFTGGCALEAAEEICDAYIDTLASLVDKSLVRRTGERFWMLETIGEYAAERFAESRAAEELRERHAEFYERLAVEAELGLRTIEQPAWFERLNDEQPNLRSALEFSLQHGEGARGMRTATAMMGFWECRNATEGRLWLDRGLGTGGGAPADQAKAHYAVGRLAFLQGDMTPATRSLREAVRLGRLAGNEETLATSLGWYAWVLEEQAEHGGSRIALEECRQLAPGVSDPWVRSWALMGVAGTLLTSGETDEAAALLREMLAVWRSCGDELSVADALNNVGYCAILRGDYDEAGRCLDESLVIARRLGDQFRIVLATGNLGLVALFENRFEAAIALFLENLRLCQRRGDLRQASESILGTASAQGALGDAELSVRLAAMYEAFRDAGISPPETIVERASTHVHAARASLDPETVAALSEQGRTMTLDAVIAELDARADTSLSRASIVPE